MLNDIELWFLFCFMVFFLHVYVCVVCMTVGMCVHNCVHMCLSVQKPNADSRSLPQLLSILSTVKVFHQSEHIGMTDLASQLALGDPSSSSRAPEFQVSCQCPPSICVGAEI